MKEGNLRVPIDKLDPNDWNPNVMPDRFYKKLVQGLRRTLDEAGRIPPVIVRPWKGRYQIIDGFHRWKALKELGEDRISIFSMKVKDQTARLLTTNLNYLRGSPDRVKYAKGLVELIELGTPFEELGELLPNTMEEIDELLEETELTVEAFRQLGDDNDEDSEGNGEKKETKTPDLWVDLTFKLPVDAARVVEKEIARISKKLKGKNIRGRSLEFMAVQSSHSDLPEDLV